MILIESSKAEDKILKRFSWKWFNIFRRFFHLRLVDYATLHFVYSKYNNKRMRNQLSALGMNRLLIWWKLKYPSEAQWSSYLGVPGWSDLGSLQFLDCLSLHGSDFSSMIPTWSLVCFDLQRLMSWSACNNTRKPPSSAALHCRVNLNWRDIRSLTTRTIFATAESARARDDTTGI